MDPITVEIVIARPRDEVFEYLADIANHAEFSDHFMVDWRLTREDSYGYGAGARYRLKAPLNRFPWGDSTVIEFERPRKLAEAGRLGKYNRIRTLGVYELEPGAAGTTRVSFTLLTEPKTISDRLMESFGARGWMKRKLSKAMRRLRAILEEDRGRGMRPTLAGGPRKPFTDSPFKP
ncbi:MAG TPA: SRPBCC family protein [Solirubrobacteraceae bacterium]